MKTRYLILILLAFCFKKTFAQTKLSGYYELNADVSSIKNGTKAYLYHPPVNYKPQYDSVLIRGGHFTFKGFLKEPELVYIHIWGLKEKKQIILTQGAIFLQPCAITLKSKDSTLLNAVITGSSLTNEYLDLSEHENNLRSQINVALKLYDKTDTADHKEKKRLALLIEQKRKSFLDDAYKAFILSHPDSYVSIYALNQYTGSEINFYKFEPLFTGISKQLQSTPAGIILSKRLENARASLPGKLAVDFSSPDTSGKAIKLSTYRGKYVLLDFWASWCGPCRHESPFLVKAYHNYKNCNFTILSVSADTKKQAWIKAIRQDHLEWEHVSDLTSPNKIMDLYNVSAIPQNYLIGPDGLIIAKNLRGEELEKKLKEVLGK